VVRLVEQVAALDSEDRKGHFAASCSRYLDKKMGTHLNLRMRSGGVVKPHEN